VGGVDISASNAGVRLAGSKAAPLTCLRIDRRFRLRGNNLERYREILAAAREREESLSRKLCLHIRHAIYWAYKEGAWKVETGRGHS
jgi:hypothetical protein